MRYLIAIVLAMAILVAATPALANPDLSSMSVEQLRAYAREEGIDLGSATSRGAIVAVIEDALAARASASAGAGAGSPSKDLPQLPDRKLLQPTLPDLSDGLPARGVSLALLGLGVFGFAILLFGVYRLFLLAHAAIAGKKGMAAIGIELAITCGGFGLVFALLGGSMYSLLVGLYEFLQFQASRG